MGPHCVENMTALLLGAYRAVLCCVRRSRCAATGSLQTGSLCLRNVFVLLLGACSKDIGSKGCAFLSKLLGASAAA